jgi:hypothetical protein
MNSSAKSMNSYILNEFISKRIHLFEKDKNKKSITGVKPCTNYHYTLCHTTIDLLIVNVSYNIYTNFIYDSHE